MSINFLLAQTPFGQLAADYPQICKVTPQSHSFFASFGFSLLCQISRLQSTGHISNCLQQLDQYLNETQGAVGGSEYYIQKLNEFRSFIDYAKTTPVATYVPWVTQTGCETISYVIRLIALIMLQKKNHPEFSTLSDMVSSPKDDQGILKVLSEYLMVAISFYNYNSFLTFDENQLTVKPLLFLGKLGQEEFVSLIHSKFVDGSDTSQLVNTFPLVHVKQAALNVGRVTSNMIPTDMQIPKIPKIQPSETPYTVMTKFIMQVLISRNWKFSIKEKEILMPILKPLLLNDFYKEEATKLYRILKSCDCEHSFSSFYLFQCGKYHCSVCISEEIELKQLMDHQVFCPCRQKVKENEISYFFLEKTRNSLQNFNKVQYGNNSPIENAYSPNTPQSPLLGGNKGMPPNSGPSTGMPHSGVSSGLPTGMTGLGMSPSMPPAMPPAMSSGIPPSMPSGMPPSMPSGMPPGMSSGMPPAMSSGMPPAMLPGMPPAMSSGVPPVMHQGMPSFPAMPGFGSSIPGENNLLQGSISLPRVSFCTKCHVPINPAEIETRGGKPYHKNCRD